MAKKYFFYTNPTLLSSPQLEEHAFGPATSINGKDRYRVTNLHETNATDVPAIAVCDGIICVQEDNKGTYSIILKPNYQPPFDFPFVKYYKYKGVKKSSLVNGNELANSTDIPFIKAIREDIAANPDDYDINDSADILGIKYTENTSVDIEGTATQIFKDEDPIDNCFYYPNPKFTLPFVKAGDKIGDFASKFGFEIVLERLGYEPELKLARTFENYIEVTTINDPLNKSGIWSLDDAAYIKHWRKKEECFNFIDPCAFFGSFYGIQKANTNKIQYSLRGISDKKRPLLTEFYSNFCSKYVNKGSIYIEIRNWLGESQSDFLQYNLDFIRGQNGTEDTDILTLLENSNWPIIKLSIINSSQNNKYIKNGKITFVRRKLNQYCNYIIRSSLVDKQNNEIQLLSKALENEFELPIGIESDTAIPSYVQIHEFYPNLRPPLKPTDNIFHVPNDKNLTDFFLDININQDFILIPFYPTDSLQFGKYINGVSRKGGISALTSFFKTKTGEHIALNSKKHSNENFVNYLLDASLDSSLPMGILGDSNEKKFSAVFDIEYWNNLGSSELGINFNKFFSILLTDNNLENIRNKINDNSIPIDEDETTLDYQPQIDDEKLLSRLFPLRFKLVPPVSGLDSTIFELKITGKAYAYEDRKLKLVDAEFDTSINVMSVHKESGQVIYSSESVANQLRSNFKNYTRRYKNRENKSELFKSDLVLRMIRIGYTEISSNPTESNKFTSIVNTARKKVNTALRIVIPELEGAVEATGYGDSQGLQAVVKRNNLKQNLEILIQCINWNVYIDSNSPNNKLNELFKFDLTNEYNDSAIINSVLIYTLDSLLLEIRGYDIEKEKTIWNESKKIPVSRTVLSRTANDKNYFNIDSLGSIIDQTNLELRSGLSKEEKALVKKNIYLLLTDKEKLAKEGVGGTFKLEYQFISNLDSYLFNTEWKDLLSDILNPNHNKKFVFEVYKRLLLYLITHRFCHRPLNEYFFYHYSHLLLYDFDGKLDIDTNYSIITRIESHSIYQKLVKSKLLSEEGYIFPYKSEDRSEWVFNRFKNKVVEKVLEDFNKKLFDGNEFNFTSLQEEPIANSKVIYRVSNNVKIYIDSLNGGANFFFKSQIIRSDKQLDYRVGKIYAFKPEFLDVGEEKYELMRIHNSILSVNTGKLVVKGTTKIFIRDSKEIDEVPFKAKFSINKSEGYISNFGLHLTSPMPCPDSRIYKIKSGDTLLSISKTFYGEVFRNYYAANVNDWKKNKDLRFYANMLLFANNPEGSKQPKWNFHFNYDKGIFELKEYPDDSRPVEAIYIKNRNPIPNWNEVYYANIASNANTVANGSGTPLDELEANYAGSYVTDWLNVEILADSHIWIPSLTYCKAVKNIVSDGDISNELTHNIADALDKYWPVGVGYLVDVGAGATFGIPIAVDLNYYMEILRIDRYKFTIVRRGTLSGGFDTGVGVSLSWGFGKPSRKGGGGMVSGVSALAGANFEAKVGVYIQEEFEFDFENNLNSLLAFAFTTFDYSGLMSVMFLGVLKAFNIYPYDYCTDWSFSFFGYVAGNAGGQIKYDIVGAGKSKEIFGNYKGNKLDDPENNPHWLNKVFSKIFKVSLVASARAEVENRIGVKYNLTDGTSKIYFETTLETSGNIPILGTLLLLNQLLNNGVGIRIFLNPDNFNINDLSEIDESIIDEINIFYFRGDLDIYDGTPAMEIGLKLENDDDSLRTFLNEINTEKTSGEIFDAINKFTSVYIEWRAIFTIPVVNIGKTKTRFKRNNLERLLDDYESFGINLSYELLITKDFAEIKDVINAIDELVDEYKSKFENKTMLTSVIIVFEDVFAALNNDTFIQNLENSAEILIRENFSLGFNVGFKASLGTKVRFDLGIEGRKINQYTLDEFLKGNGRLNYIKGISSSFITPDL